MLEENLALADFTLTDEDMQAIAAMDKNQRFNDPAVFSEDSWGQFYPIWN